MSIIDRIAPENSDAQESAELASVFSEYEQITKQLQAELEKQVNKIFNDPKLEG